MTIFETYYHSFFSACGLPYHFDPSIALKSLDYKHIKNMANRKSIIEKLHEACLKDETQKVTHFLREMDVTKRQSLLHAAIRKRNLEIVKLLLRHNVEVNRIDKSGKTPLSFAVAKGNVEIIKELLNNGAEVDGKSSSGYTPFLVALIYKEIDQRINKAKILLDHGANIDICLFHGLTALHYMAIDGKLDRVKILLEHKANINAVNVSNRTPLHYATLNSRMNVVEILLINGANANLQFTLETRSKC